MADKNLTSYMNVLLKPFPNIPLSVYIITYLICCEFIKKIENMQKSVKFIYSEKATQFFEISTLLLTGTT